MRGSDVPRSADWANAVANDFDKRPEWEKSPELGLGDSRKLVRLPVVLACPWYRASTSTQNPIIAQPTLAAYHAKAPGGCVQRNARATKELSEAVFEWTISDGDLGDTLTGE